MTSATYGLITFYSWNHAVRAERVLQKAEFVIDMVPAPREFTSNCGTALQFFWNEQDQVLETLQNAKVPIEHTYPYPDGSDVDSEDVSGDAPARSSLTERISSWLGRSGTSDSRSTGRSEP